VFDGRQQLGAATELPGRAEDVLLGLVGGQIADLLNLRPALSNGPVDAGSSTVGVKLAGQVGADLLRHRRDLVLSRRALLATEQGGEEPAAAGLFDAVDVTHSAGAVQGDTGLRSLAARLHEDSRDHLHLTA